MYGVRLRLRMRKQMSGDVLRLPLSDTVVVSLSSLFCTLTSRGENAGKKHIYAHERSHFDTHISTPQAATSEAMRSK